MRFERRGWEFKSLRVRHSDQIPRLRSGFRLLAPASLTPAKRLKFKSLRVRHSIPLPATAIAKNNRSLPCARHISAGLSSTMQK